MMDELQDLREHIEHGRYAAALTLIGEMEEMSRDDKIQKIEAFLQVLLVHLIKQQAEGRTTRSWDVSIRNAADAVRRAGGGHRRDPAIRAATGIAGGLRSGGGAPRRRGPGRGQRAVVSAEAAIPEQPQVPAC